MTVGNAVSYYQAGPEMKERPGWSNTDKGYVAPNLQFGLDPYSLHDGILVEINGAISNDPLNQLYEEFGKGTFDILVGATRGPNVYSYPPLVFLWREDCGGPNGENKYTHWAKDVATGLSPYAMGMNNEGRTIEFTPACPDVEWSGTLLRHQNFAVTSTSPQAVDIAVQVAGSAELTDARPVQKFFLDYRLLAEDGVSSDWRSTAVAADSLVSLQPFASDSSLFTGTWSIPENFQDGTYEIKAVAECTAGGSSAAFDRAETPLIAGRVARSAPSVVSVRASWLGSDSGAEGTVTIAFADDVKCGGDQRALVATQFYDLDGVDTTVSPTVTCRNNIVEVGGISNSALLSGVDVSNVYDAVGNAAPVVKIGFGTKSKRAATTGVHVVMPSAEFSAEFSALADKVDILIANGDAAAAAVAEAAAAAI